MPGRRGRFSLWGPFPSYAKQTKGGGRVRITGCCLPLALGLGGAAGMLARGVWRQCRS